MTDDATVIDCLVHHHETTITTTSVSQSIYTITTDVRQDVLDAFDTTLELDTFDATRKGEDREDFSDEIAALIHLEDECRDEQ